jgi:hypothetical protein
MKQTVSSKDQTIKQLEEKSTVTTVNAKKFNLGVGVDTDKNFSLYSSYNVLGPVFIGGRIDATISKTIPRAGIFAGISL